MKYYRMFTFYLLFSLFGLFYWQSFQLGMAKNLLTPVSGHQEIINESDQAPFNLVFHFYEAIEKNDWNQIKNLVTPFWWKEMNRIDYLQQWQKKIQDDPSIRLVMFLVTGQKIELENNFAWIMGKVDWVSQKQIMDDSYETIFLIKEKNEWKIDQIQKNIPVEIVANFYETINQGKFNSLASFLTKGLWKRINQNSLIDDLKKDWNHNKTSSYCVFYVKDFGSNRNSAWVKGDVLWNPLLAKAKETPVTIFLINVDKEWKIDKISEHWEEK